jgi:hypothetical protein
MTPEQKAEQRLVIEGSNAVSAALAGKGDVELFLALKILAWTVARVAAAAPTAELQQHAVFAFGEFLSQSYDANDIAATFATILLPEDGPPPGARH